MCRLNEKKLSLENQISDLQSQLEIVEDKIRRKNFKRNRKAFRKKMANDPMYRIMARMERTMNEPRLELVSGDMLGISMALGRNT